MPERPVRPTHPFLTEPEDPSRGGRNERDQRAWPADGQQPAFDDESGRGSADWSGADWSNAEVRGGDRYDSEPGFGNPHRTDRHESDRFGGYGFDSADRGSADRGSAGRGDRGWDDGGRDSGGWDGGGRDSGGWDDGGRDYGGRQRDSWDEQPDERVPRGWAGRADQRGQSPDRRNQGSDQRNQGSEQRSRRPQSERPEQPEDRPARTRSSRLGPLTAASGVINLVRRRPSFDDLVPQDDGPGRRPPNNPESFRRPKKRDRRPLIFGAGALALLLVIVGVFYAMGRGGDDASTGQASVSTPGQVVAPDDSADEEKKAEATSGAEKKVKRGVFRGTSPSAVAAFEDQLGLDMQYVVDYSPRRTWDDIANPLSMLRTWQGTEYRMVFATAMLPGIKSEPSTLERGAQGDYNGYYETLAKNLVAYGQGDAILRLGWEANVSSFKWHPEGAEGNKHFKAYWREIVTTMRSVPGAEGLEFDWNVNNGGDSYDSTLFYPGNKYVDYIGVDVYDISWAEGSYPYPGQCNNECRRGHQELAWQNIMDANFGLNFWAGFAKSKKKPLSLPEWGIWERPDKQGGDDNPYFIEQMYKFVDDPRNNVAYQAYFEFDVGSKGTHQLSVQEKSLKRYIKLFGK
ncbi:glycosyl hydrolase [Kineosporia babensis]|uniref:GH26 domain-containing protein n=1 Tax=Kineosporia babensis TaxID=499548 RepID=A0A9X1SXF7_9ACTN|nr:glycosyl hydrolase [Kineosporia babensis]MCD5310198.1 hypothetical protein [Kineosporia babensis]